MPNKPTAKELASEAARAMARHRLAKLGKKGRTELARLAGKAAWADMSPRERSLEMKRRCRVRKRNRLKRAIEKLED